MSSAVGAWHLHTAGELTASVAVAVGLWLLLAAYVVIVSLLPSMAKRRPDARVTYSVVAIAGSVALLTASGIFLVGDLVLIGVLEAVIAVAMMLMVLPEVRRAGQDALVLSVMGSMVSLASVLAVSVTL